MNEPIQGDVSTSRSRFLLFLGKRGKKASFWRNQPMIGVINESSCSDASLQDYQYGRDRLATRIVAAFRRAARRSKCSRCDRLSAARFSGASPHACDASIRVDARFSRPRTGSRCLKGSSHFLVARACRHSHHCFGLPKRIATCGNS